jgi:hypothetical protein
MNIKVGRTYEKHNVPSPLSSVQKLEKNITIPIAFVNQSLVCGFAVALMQ